MAEQRVRKGAKRGPEGKSEGSAAGIRGQQWRKAEVGSGCKMRKSTLREEVDQARRPQRLSFGDAPKRSLDIIRHQRRLPSSAPRHRSPKALTLSSPKQSPYAHSNAVRMAAGPAPLRELCEATDAPLKATGLQRSNLRRRRGNGMLASKSADISAAGKGGPRQNTEPFAKLRNYDAPCQGREERISSYKTLGNDARRREAVDSSPTSEAAESANGSSKLATEAEKKQKDAGSQSSQTLRWKGAGCRPSGAFNQASRERDFSLPKREGAGNGESCSCGYKKLEILGNFAHKQEHRESYLGDAESILLLRRKKCWMGRGSTGSSSCLLLFQPSIQAVAHKRERDASGSLSANAAKPYRPERPNILEGGLQSSASSDEQQCAQIQVAHERAPQAAASAQLPQGSHNSRARPTTRQYMGGQTLSASRSQRAQTLNNRFPTIGEAARAPHDRLARINRRIAAPSLPFKAHMPGRRRSRRVRQKLGSRKLALLPSGRDLTSCDQKVITRQCSGNSHRASLASSTLAASASKNMRARFPASPGCASTTVEPTRTGIGLGVRSLLDAVESIASNSNAVASA